MRIAFKGEILKPSYCKKYTCIEISYNNAKIRIAPGIEYTIDSFNKESNVLTIKFLEFKNKNIKKGILRFREFEEENIVLQEEIVLKNEIYKVINPVINIKEFYYGNKLHLKIELDSNFMDNFNFIFLVENVDYEIIKEKRSKGVYEAVFYIHSINSQPIYVFSCNNLILREKSKFKFDFPFSMNFSGSYLSVTIKNQNIEPLIVNKVASIKNNQFGIFDLDVLKPVIEINEHEFNFTNIIDFLKET